MYKILTLNNIAVEGLRHLPRERYEVASEIAHPDAILVRSHNMHDMDIPETVAAIGRAGAGTNNIPVDAMAARGVPVFNAPGANANAVKESQVHVQGSYAKQHRSRRVAPIATRALRSRIGDRPS